ncbi:GNAT family N-acetyltransferase [Ornithinibacillus gellani]|uniref:GNAT family N-acetyltransferase n=1 Tax=Ornithinibacillus gellani TaxID=2293253 RepID=UPI000F48941C|nr:GNAT family N-acetyltransferase [Ornithinibacillus gellani]TQS74204.1 GNAT family N-acetyltransferase [Ornithinibacillus gellani]
MNKQELEETADLIALLNRENTHHIGFCGQDKDEILDTLQHDFSDVDLDRSFAVMKKDGRITAALGLDINLDDGSAEMWGPFIRETDWQKTATLLWQDILKKVGTQVNTFHGYYHVDHTRAAAFMQSIHAEAKDRHHTLTIHRKDFKCLSQQSVQELIPAQEPAFQLLHDRTFPKAYYSGATILTRRNEQQKIFYAEINGKLAGYVYVEGNPTFQEGNIEFIAVAPEFRGQGIGTKLVQRALQFLFDNLQIEVVTLSVMEQLSGAIQLYKRAGFQESSKLQHYIVNVQLV